jgi:ribosome maturation factor RimP
MQEQENIGEEMEQLLAGAGLSLVEFSLTRRGNSVSARAVVYSRAGTGTDECSKAHRLIYPRLQVLFGVEDPQLEVSSPGIDRNIRSWREYAVFAGKGLKILLENESEWIRGKIVSATEKELVLSTDEGTEVFDLAAVTKARLDSTQEGD